MASSMSLSFSRRTCKRNKPRIPKTSKIHFKTDPKTLKEHNITPIFVFDGDRLPMKSQTESKRHEGRKSRKILANDLLKKGETVLAIKKFSE
mmetsp:Transcript_6129/g.5269  ORF Transcript_6129/g.5269 Transcript_6129/m.5269 type:complete len:92 (+) Transcript_6129:93-368(+)